MGEGSGVREMGERGEGEPFSPRRTIQWRRLSTARCALFPLPEGKGQGEGKRRELPSRVSEHSRKCRTERVLRQSRRFPQMTMNPKQKRFSRNGAGSRGNSHQLLLCAF